MPKFSYTAVDARGKTNSGVLDAVDQGEATTKIKQLGFFPTRIVETTGEKARGGTGPTLKKRGKRVGSKVLTVFTRQLATLIDAGLPLLKSLQTLSRQERNPVMKNTMQDLEQAVQSGNNFSEALTQHPKIFDNLFVNMVRAGEAGGVMEVVLLRLAEFQEKSQKIKSKVLFAMVYPGVVLSIAMLILAAMLVFVVPQFEKIFKDTLNGKPLPLITEYVVEFSRFMVNEWYIVIGILVGFYFGIGFFFSTAIGKSIFDKVILKVPGFGNLVLKTGVARFSRTLGTLINSGVPILQALNITRDTAGNGVIAEAINKIHDSVKEGESVVGPMEATGVFPAMLVSMVQVGEETGQLPDMLLRVAVVYEEEVDNAVTALTTLLEPIMIVLLAVVVGTIVIALFLPMISLISAVQDQSAR